MSVTGSHFLAEELAHARRKWRSVPLWQAIDGRCECPRPDCGSAGKHPRTIHGLKDGTTDEEVIRERRAAWPNAGVGVVTGDGLVMIGPDGAAGIAALTALEKQHGQLPPTPTAVSGSGGRHFYFAVSGGKISNSKNHRGLPIDVRGENGLAVAPPSQNCVGSYKWLLHPDATPLAPMPPWLYEWCQPEQKKAKVFTVGGDGPSARDRAVAWLAKVPGAVSGSGGHGQTLEAARGIVYGFDLGPDEGFSILWANYNPRCLPPWSEAELRHKCSEADTVPFGKPRGYLLNAEAEPVHASAEVDIEDLEMPKPEPWPTLDPLAFHGLVGQVVATIAPESEADPVALAGDFIVSAGSVIGRRPHFLIEGRPHHVNLFAAIVGKSSRGRKGTSGGRSKQALAFADNHWTIHNVATGLSSGEGLIHAVRDRSEKREKGKGKGGESVVVDEGVSDKRLLVREEEFASVLRVMQREGNTLSIVARAAWDTGDLRTLTKNNPTRATGAHISLVTHITRQELAKCLKEESIFNGFANRFLWLLVKRARLLPDGGRRLDLAPLGGRLRVALEKARDIGEMWRSEGAAALWHSVYPKLTADRGDLYGVATGRAEAQVLRLSMLYALLDGTAIVDVEHLRAALAFWDYAEQSARIIFGEEVQDPLGELILAKLEASAGGLTRNDIRNAFHRNIPAKLIVDARAKLRDRGLAYATKEPTAGRPAERWRSKREAVKEEVVRL